MPEYSIHRNPDLKARSDYLYDAPIGSGMTRRWLCDTVAEFEAENAKLRELVKAFDWCTEHFDLPNRCDKCLLEQSDKLTPECEIRIRELGIEVEPCL